MDSGEPNKLHYGAGSPRCSAPSRLLRADAVRGCTC